MGPQVGGPLMIGGNGSARPRLADILVEDLSFDEARTQEKLFH